ncbi:hypothetical protein ACHAXR_004235 [Thalassiosira sp. AJA248-18]
MENVDIDGTPFSVLMERAVKLKQFQTKSRYDELPSFYASSIFPHNDVINAREFVLFDDRLAAANRMKDDGNSAFRDGNLTDALSNYEMALSVFRFLENINPAWKSEGIKDQFVKEHSYQCENEQDCQQLHGFLVKCYNNIALVSYKMANFPLVIEACDYAIAVDGENDKSFYLRAKARIAPKGSGSVEQSLARSDLRLAIKNNPRNNDAKNLLQKLSVQMKLQQRTDKKVFKGLFDRGEVYDAQELNEEKSARRKSAEQDQNGSKEQDIILAKQLIQLYDERGMKAEKQKLEQSLRREMSVKAESANLNDLDFRNPTTKMNQGAKFGINLKDQQAVELLEEMREKHKKAGDDTSTANNRNAISSGRIYRGDGPKYIALFAGIIILAASLHVVLHVVIY